jgi:phosphate/sulfate permease
MQFDLSIFAIIGFIFAAYAVVGNDALQTLGTFINSNRRLPWWALFLFASTILIVVFFYGYVTDGGELRNPDGSPKALCDFRIGCDTSYGRLDNTEKYPIFEPQWYHTLPPLVLLILTRFGIPVSTTFMVLTIFATMAGLSSMLQKSLIGYGLAFLVGAGIYVVLSRTLEQFFRKTEHQQHAPVWVLLQWLTTAYLWSVWLMQDFANIFIFLPRGDGVTPGSGLNPAEAIAAVAVTVLLLGYTFWNRGGPVQRILQSKTSVTDIRSATVIDFTYASLLFYFKELNDVPMSTTWVFLGLIAGREYAFAVTTKAIRFMRTARVTLSDLSKAFVGLVISVDMARGLPWLARGFETDSGVFQLQPLSELAPSSNSMWFLIIINLMIIPVALYLAKNTVARMIGVTAVYVLAAGAFLTLPIY